MGFIIGSIGHTPMFPDPVFKEMREHFEDKGELPPLIFLNEGDYEQFHKHVVSRPSLVTEAKCLSNIGSKFRKCNDYNCGTLALLPGCSVCSRVRKWKIVLIWCISYVLSVLLAILYPIAE